MMYQQIIRDLQTIYDQDAGERDKKEKSLWKQQARENFLRLLRHEGKNSLLEIGAGTGADSLYFHNNGLQVIATDLSAEMVRLCRQKKLEAYACDFLNLGFAAESFDVVYGINCLLHVPKSELTAVLQAIHFVLKSDGLFFLGMYGGIKHEGTWAEDHHDPKRFFALYPDIQIQQVAGQIFRLERFEAIPVPRGSDPAMHFQLLILRR